jgi:hypothetical protein
MSIDLQFVMKSLSPKIASKALQTFDRATTVVVGACWGAAVLMMAFAIYTTMLSVSAKRASETALVTEPSLPKVVHKTIDGRAAQTMVERLQRRYPDVTFSLATNQNITITAVDGSKFRQWLTALSYIDTISPEYHWSISAFCVGKCPGNELMRAVLTGERISFEAPQP